MTYGEKSFVGATILPSSGLPKPNYPAVILEKPSMESLDSSYAMSAANHLPASKEEYDPTSTNPCSAFYSHPTTRTSFEQQKTESKTKIRIYEHDLESGSQVVVPMKRESKASVEKVGKKDLCCQRRSFNPMQRLSQKQRMWVKLAIALVIVGAAVGLGLGIALVTLSYSALYRACLPYRSGDKSYDYYSKANSSRKQEGNRDRRLEERQCSDANWRQRWLRRSLLNQVWTLLTFKFMLQVCYQGPGAWAYSGTFR